MSPLEQFALRPVVPLEILGYDISLTNSSLTMWFVSISMIFLFIKFLPQKSDPGLRPGRVYTLFSFLYTYIKDMVVQSMGKEAVFLTPLLFTLFIFIVMCNLWGMVPFQFTVTSHISVTLLLSLLIFILSIILGLRNSPKAFLGHFVPSGVPKAVVPFVAIVELVSFFSRPFSLAVRLFANMVAGHAMLKVFASFIEPLLSQGGCVGALSILPYTLCVLLTGFEILVALLQAYVFLVISTVYLKDSFPDH